MNRLDHKLARIHSGEYRPDDFIIADAKDPDMGSGIHAIGPRPNGRGYYSRQEFLQQIREVVAQDVVDIMLTSASNMHVLASEGVFHDSAVQPAIRANDTTDIWGGVRGASYTEHNSRPFRSATLSQVMHGTADMVAERALTGTDLGLYSMTFSNDLAHDLATLEAFGAFRREANAARFRYFLEVFNPGRSAQVKAEDVPFFVNDAIVRSLAGVAGPERPLFLKIPFNGPDALEELASYDASLVVGVLGGGAGTTRDTFELIRQAERYGARLALFGRKIRLAEAPLAIIALMREVASGRASPEQAVRSYHGTLQQRGLRAARSLEDDLQITETVLKKATQ